MPLRIRICVGVVPQRNVFQSRLISGERMKIRQVAVWAIGPFVLLLFSSAAAAAMIDLNDFFADPTVTIVPDGSSALMEEDLGFSTVVLENNPTLGDPEVIVAALGTGLYLDYAFQEAAGETDSFLVELLDAMTSMALGPAFVFSSDVTSMGTILFDLSTLVGSQLGLRITLISEPGDIGVDSTLTVSNLRLDPLTPMGNGLPLPGTMWLLLFGLGAARLRVWKPVG